jgi:hypothetical protein
VICLGLRLAVSGGREAVVRLVILAAAVGLGVGLLLTTVSAEQKVPSRATRQPHPGGDVRDGRPAFAPCR